MRVASTDAPARAQPARSNAASTVLSCNKGCLQKKKGKHERERSRVCRDAKILNEVPPINQLGEKRDKQERKPDDRHLILHLKPLHQRDQDHDG